MIIYLFLCLLATGPIINAKPAHLTPEDLASHILIVTPQAEVHLEPALKYAAVLPQTFIQHLSPLARYSAPLDETVIYVPSAGQGHEEGLLAAAARRQDAKQYEQISQQVQGAIMQGTSAVGPQLSEAAGAVASGVSSAGSGFFPALFPPAASGSSEQKEEKLKTDKIEAEIPLLSTSRESHRFYALTPAISHVIGVYVGPLSAIRARSIQEEKPLSADLKGEKGVTPLFEDRLKEELKEEQKPESREDKIDEKKFENVKCEETEQEKLKFEIKKFVEEKKLVEEEKVEKRQFVEDKKFDEIKFVEKRTEEQELKPELKEDKPLSLPLPLPLQQKGQQQQQQQQQQIAEPNKLQDSEENLELKVQSIRDRKKQSIVQEVKEQFKAERKDILPQQEQKVIEQPQEKQLLEISQQLKEEQPKDLQPQQQKQEFEEIKEANLKREKISLQKGQENLLLEKEQLFKKESKNSDKSIVSETELQQPQRANSGRVEGFESAPAQQARPLPEEAPLQQTQQQKEQQKPLSDALADQLPAENSFVPETKAV